MPKSFYHRVSVVWLAIAVTAVLWLVGGCGETIPPHDLTVTRMAVTETRLRLYWTNNGKLPPKLSDLPQLASRDNETVDGWGREIKYQFEGTKVILTSPGEDGKSGATSVISKFDVSTERK